MSSLHLDSSGLAVVGLGANLGNPLATLNSALLALKHLPTTTLLDWSAPYRSAPVDATGPEYFNGAALVRTELSPMALLEALLSIELQHGRQRPFRHAPRSLDLDLLLFGDQQISHPSLTLPHPRLHLRAFALLPLLELLPAAHIPGRGVARDFLPGTSDQAIQRTDLKFTL